MRKRGRREAERRVRGRRFDGGYFFEIGAWEARGYIVRYWIPRVPSQMKR